MTLFGKAKYSTVASCDNACERKKVQVQKVGTTGSISEQVGKRLHNNCGKMRRLKASFANSDAVIDGGVGINLNGEISPLTSVNCFDVFFQFSMLFFLLSN